MEVQSINELIGECIVSVDGLELESSEVTIKTESGNTFIFKHYQACCEYVRLADIDGDLDCLVGGYVMWADIRVSDASDDEQCGNESGTWTFYDIQTSKGYVWMRWLGESNGYYSENVTVSIYDKKGKEINEYY